MGRGPAFVKKLTIGDLWIHSDSGHRIVIAQVHRKDKTVEVYDLDDPSAGKVQRPADWLKRNCYAYGIGALE